MDSKNGVLELKTPTTRNAKKVDLFGILILQKKKKLFRRLRKKTQRKIKFPVETKLCVNLFFLFLSFHKTVFTSEHLSSYSLHHFA